MHADARIGYGSVRARGVAPLAFVEHAARAFQSHVTRGIRKAAVACASACKASQARRRASSGFAVFSRISADRHASRSLLARFFRASRPLLVRLFRASPPLLACFALRSAAIRRRSCALRRGAPAPVVAEPVKCAPSSRGIGRPGRQVAVAKMPIVPRDYIVGATALLQSADSRTIVAGYS
ncbi:hypothetical protein L0Z26_28780 [Burkholderia multivorans]|uniref:hypothetical protein n=1 Tax=Burkholderia multivorans TaxID=87883 RepID=UPI00208F6FEB|nr:hypothetical protein [Burkholderia multivorans]MCO1345856.1 hypothetical protein [Burkholderia multivorans]